MLRRRWELCEVGVHGQNGTVVTEKDLQDIIETFKEKAPITIGHKLTSLMPKMGNVVKLYLTAGKKKLEGDVELNDLGEKLYEAGYFDEWSIGAKRKAGKSYLHHLALCGEVPAAVRGLKDLGKALNLGDINFENLETVDLSDSGDVDIIPSRENDRRPNEEEGMTDEEKKKFSDLEKKVADLEKEKTELASKKTDDESAKLLSDKEAEITALHKQLLEGKKTELKKAAEGRIPKGKVDDLLALADQLDVDGTIELSDAAGKKETVSPFDLLTRVIESIPTAVKTGELNLGDSDDTTESIDLADLMANC